MSFSLTRKTDYALVALSALARQWKCDGPPLSARQLSEVNNLPLQLLMNVLKDLHRAGLVASRRGASGGYYLKSQPADLTLGQVISVFEGPISVTLCSGEHGMGDDSGCQIISHCPISGPIRKFNGLLNKFLADINLDQLLEQENFSMPTGVNV